MMKVARFGGEKRKRLGLKQRKNTMKRCPKGGRRNKKAKKKHSLISPAYVGPTG
jgi:hypothetical protein